MTAGGRSSGWRRWVVACGCLLAVYVALSLSTSPRGFLGTDTGGKVATLRAMDACGCADPDVGYWAERWDPDGSLHPLYYSSRIGDRWVNATTLPVLFLARPLFAVGGYRLALLLPMLGSVAAALAAAAVARRVGDGSAAAAWRAFWLVGLASPVAVYALDLWEHSIGVALMAWAVVALDGFVKRSGRNADMTLHKTALAGAGVLFGLAATLRAEAFVYVAVSAVVMAVVATRQRFPVRAVVAAGAVFAVCFAVPVVANEGLERAVLGESRRAPRVAGAASLAGDAPADRLDEALFTTVALEGGGAGTVLGATAAALLGLGWYRRRDARFATASVAGAGALYAVRFAGGLGFVPGMAVAWVPATGGRGGRVFTWIAVGAIPVVLATQFTGGAAPQWAGRYLLTSGLLLTAVAAASLDRLARPTRIAIVALAAATTAFGVSWLAVRSDDVDRTIAAIDARGAAAGDRTVVVSTIAHLGREGGAFYSRDRRWLTAVGTAEEREAAAVAHRAGASRIVLVEYAARAKPPNLGGWRATATDQLRLFAGVDLRLTTLEAGLGG